jgi:hypothetical protein
MSKILILAGIAAVCTSPALWAQQAGVSGGVFSHVDVAATSASVEGANGINAGYHPEARLMERRVEVPLQSAQGNGSGSQNSGQSNGQAPPQTTNGQTTRGIVPGAETAGNYTIIHLASKVGLKEAKVEVSEGYIQPTAGHQFTEFTVRAFGLNAVLRAAAIGIINQADNVPPDWGQGWEPFGERVGSAFGREAVDAAALFGTAAIFREDVEFYRCNCVGFFPRLKHAIWSSFSARAGSDGNRVFSPAPIISPYAGAFTSLAWYPDRYGPKDALRWGSYDILYGIGENIGREFLNINF